MSRAALAAALCWTASIPDASAAEPDTPLVVFYAPPELSGAAAPVRGALEAVAQRSGSALVDVSLVIEPPAAPLHLRRAIEAYHDFRYAEALNSADAGLAEASVTGGLGLSSTDLSDLLIYRALALTERGDSAGAWQDFVRAVTLDPSRTLDPVRFPPRVIETFARAARAVATTPPATLTVALPSACELWLDGRPITGQSSLSTTRGEHYLRARCPGHEPYGARVLVASERHGIAPRPPVLAPPSAARLRAMAAERGFHAALSATLSRSDGGRLLLTLRRIAGQGAARRGMVVLELTRTDPTAGVAAAMSRLMEPAPAITAIRPAARPAGGTPWYRSPWLWGAAGAAIAAAVLIPFAVDSRDPAAYDVRPRGDLPP